MRWRILPAVLLMLALMPGWWWAWRESTQIKDQAFSTRRLAFLEEENRRLSRALVQTQQVQAAQGDTVQRSAIEKAVASLRDLPFLKPVTYRQIPRADLPGILRQKLAQQVPDREFASEGIAFAALGLLPAGTDLKKTYLALLGEQIGAFYDQHSEELFTFSGQPLEQSQNRVILAHELTHALEDQHFHLANLPLETKGNDDRALAASALVEGDATLVMNQYLLGNLSASVVKDSLASALTTDVRQLVAAPRYLRETLVFPYLQGQEFCQALYDHGGWPALAEAFRHPPSSTAQILHPDRFLSPSKEEPIQIEYGNVAANGATPIFDNVLGEFGIRQLLIGWIKDEAKASSLAADWRGDRYLVYGDAKANSYLWCTQWSSESAAKQFAAAAKTGWQIRYGVKHASVGAEDDPVGTDTLKTTLACRLPGGRELRISQSQQEVTLVEAQDSLWLSALEQVLSSAPPTSTPRVVNE